MHVMFKEDITINDSKGESVIVFHAGSTQMAIDSCYLPDDAKIDGLGLKKDNINHLNNYYYFIVWGKTLAVAKEKCEIPKSIGWKANV